jgi:hypothetical protein
MAALLSHLRRQAGFQGLKPEPRDAWLVGYELMVCQQPGFRMNLFNGELELE